MNNKQKTIKYIIFLGLLILAYFISAKPVSAFYAFPEKTPNLAKNNKIMASNKVISAPNVINAPKTTSQEIKIDKNEIVTQVKTADSDTVYHLDRVRNVKKSYVNKQGYFAYGNKLDEIKIVSQDELNKWPDLRIVTSRQTQDIYYLGNNKKAKIDQTHFYILGIDPEKIINIHPIDLATYQTASYTDVGLSVPEQKDAISIKLAPENPKSGFLVNNTQDNLLSIFTLSSPLETAKITSITFNLGILNSNAIEKLYLTDEGGTKLKVRSSYSNRKATFRFPDSLLIRKNQPKKLKLFVNLASCEACANNIIQATINNADDIEASIDFVDNFPIKASTFQLIDNGGNIANVIIEEKETNLSPTIVIGTTDQILAKFQISETSGKEDIVLKQASFIARGTIQKTDLANFKIKIDGKVIAQAKAMTQDEKIIFDIPDFIINKKESKELMITSNIINGENKTIDIDFESAKILGKTNKFSLKTNLSRSINSSLTITKEALSIFSLDLKNNQKVFTQQKGVIIGSFQIRNINQRINLESINVRLTKSSSAPELEDSIYLVDYKTGEVFGSADGENLARGIINIGLNNHELSSRQELTISLITNVPLHAKDGDNYQIHLDKIHYEAGNGEYYEENINIPGSLLVVNRSNLYIHNSGESNSNYIKGQKNLKIASFFIEVSAIEDVIINNITLARGNTSGNITYDNGFSNMRLHIGRQRYSASNCGTIKKPVGGSFIFGTCNARLVSGNRYDINIYVDTEEDLKIGQTQLMLADLFATSIDSGLATVVWGENTQSYTTNFGEVKMDVELLNGGQVMRGENDNIIGSFKINNTGDEDINLKNLNITTSNIGFSYGSGYSDLRIANRNDGNPITIQNIAIPVGGSNRFNFSSVVPAKTEVIYDIYVKANGNVPTGNFKIYLNRLTAHGTNSRINATIAGDPTRDVNVNVN